MKHTTASTLASPKTGSNLGWSQALTLQEQLVLRQTILEKENEGIEPEVLQAEKAWSQLKRWKTQPPFDKDNYFEQWLAQFNLSEAEFLNLLAIPPQMFAQYQKELPSSWLAQLQTAFSGETLPGKLPDHIFTHGFLKSLEPLLNKGFSDLNAGIARLAGIFPELPFDKTEISQLLLGELTRQILPQIMKTLVLELNIARLQERLEGVTSEARFENFITELGQPGRMLELLEEFPVLARLLVTLVNHWVNYSLEFLEHLCKDWPEIIACFNQQRMPGRLVEIVGGAGDLHRQGRSVLRLKFACGFQLIYKPRSLAVDLHFQQLLAWLNEQAVQTPFRLLKLLDRGTYGWSEFVTAYSCTTPAEVERFYHRQGGYLALLYALGANDFHHENLIAAGEQPVLIDLETLFHPRLNEQLASVNPLIYSVLNVGLLPMYAWVSQESAGMDISGVGGGKPGQLSPRPVVAWESTNTDQMRLAKQRVALPGTANRPLLDGEEVELYNYSQPFLTGFSEIYRLLCHHRETLLAGPLARFASDEIRVILRATRVYSRLLTEGSHPTLLRNGLSRQRHFDHLWAAVPWQPYLVKAIPFEQADLEVGDIPFFTTRPQSRDIYSSRGEVLKDFLNEPALVSVTKRLRGLDESDLARQLYLIQLSFSTIPLNDTTILSARPTSSRQKMKEPLVAPRSTQLLKEALAIGQRLEELALPVGKGVSWAGLQLLHERRWSVTAADTNLYDGLPGIILFLAYLAEVTGQEAYTHLAKAALATLRGQLEQIHPAPTRPGFLNGWGGLIYLFSHLGALWHDSAFFNEALEIVGRLPELIENDAELDLGNGSAGVILGLLSLYRVAPSPVVVQIAEQAGTHLVAKARPMPVGVAWDNPLNSDQPLVGFAHGAAGIAFSLMELYRVSGNPAFRETAQSALAYERSTYSEERSNWPDLRRDPYLVATRLKSGSEDPEYLAFWCHGAGGIGLSRLALLSSSSLFWFSSQEEEVIRQELISALKTTLAEGFGGNHSLCHGDLGNLELLWQASRQFDLSYQQDLEKLMAQLWADLKRRRYLTGVPLHPQVPGLMTGLAGIGYGLLRLAAPDKVPSVLLGEAPR